MSKKWVAIILFVILLVAVFYLLHKNLLLEKQLKQEPKIITKIKEKVIYKNKFIHLDKNNSIISLDKSDIKDYLNNHYSFLSNKNKNKIFNAIFKYSKEYDISPLILFAVLHTESSMRFWIKHSRVYVSVPINPEKTKFVRIHTRAIGLGGIIWEMWKWDLLKNKIAETKSDLYNIDTNIRATAFIISKLQEKPLLKGVNSKIESAIIRYYGVIPNNKEYYLKKINNFVGDLFSKKLYQIKE